MIPSNQLINDVKRALQEDMGDGDITAQLLPRSLNVHAEIISREPMVMCGEPWATEAFSMVDSSINVHWLVKEGAYIEQPATLCKISGPARGILTAERTVLNFLQTLSGTATVTRKYVTQLGGTHAKLLDTRKTIPGMRHAQKYAVVCGGGTNHRMGLYDAFLIKENHIKAHGSIQLAIHEARILHPTHFLEVEVETLSELDEALNANPSRILLDNFTLDMMREAVKMNQVKKIPLEVSGGVDSDSIRAIADTGIDYISVGALTKHVRAIDLSLLIKDNV
jgi:nicotinate-nucleotide pyrophosphorylase (carboxylating)